MWTVYWNKKSDAVGKVVANRIVSISFSLASLTVDDTSQSTKIESRHFRNGNKLSSHGLGRVRARDIIKSNSTGTDYLKKCVVVCWCCWWWRCEGGRKERANAMSEIHFLLRRANNFQFQFSIVCEMCMHAWMWKLISQLSMVFPLECLFWLQFPMRRGLEFECECRQNVCVVECHKRHELLSAVKFSFFSPSPNRHIFK